VIGIEQVEVPDVRRGGLISDVHGMFQRHVPDGKSLELGIARFSAVPVIVVQLGEAGGQLAAARPRTGHDHEGLLRRNALVGPVPLVADDHIHIGGITFGEAMAINLDPSPFQLVLEQHGRRLAVETGDDDTQHVDPPRLEIVDQFHRVGVVGDAEIRPDLFPLDVAGVDAQQDIGLVFQLLQEPHLDVGIVSGQNPGGVIVVEQLASEFEIELTVETLHAVKNASCLFPDIKFIV